MAVPEKGSSIFFQKGCAFWKVRTILGGVDEAKFFRNQGTVPHRKWYLTLLQKNLGLIQKSLSNLENHSQTKKTSRSPLPGTFIHKMSGCCFFLNVAHGFFGVSIQGLIPMVARGFHKENPRDIHSPSQNDMTKLAFRDRNSSSKT